ncbi:LysR family transcriptional regulator [Photobacterium sp. CAU 1568]|uniref:LysR family transcriptional regulator n=1 Tax=Photobacterium arenosum TaxID=2774143 RepID=A0ABR9BJS5_9GAMM|nr:LysR substrate-binding domain-containing protein [Photobacterium arenosum]MBD8511925.1 LysR family transcriptional regulator [Photobacterium arenosum]
MLKNINLLVTFECAARHNSYSLAAAELCISQAAVSQQMRQLEQSLGCRLFVRKGKRMLLSQQGQSLLKCAQQALAIIHQGVNQLHQEEIAGELTISSTQAFTTLWLMPRMQRFSELHPDIQIRVISSAGFDDLRQAHIDLAIRFGTEVEKYTQDSLSCEYFGQSAVYPVCSAQLARDLALSSPDDLLSTWLVTLENPGAYDWQSWFENAGVQASNQHAKWTRVNSTDMALTAVLNGHGVTLAVPYLYQSPLDAGQLVIPFQLPHPNPVRRYMVYDPNSARLARLKVFMAWLKAEMADA